MGGTGRRHISLKRTGRMEPARMKTEEELFPLSGMSVRFQNACMQGDVDAVRKYLNHEDPIYKMDANVVNQAGSTPMQLATWMQQDEVIKVLLEHGAGPLSATEDK